VPVSPEGAAYRYDVDTDEMVNERHGSYRRPRLRDGMEQGSGGRQLLGLLRSLHVGLRFREDGIHTTLTFDRSTDADKQAALDPAHLAIVKRGGWVELDESRPGHPYARVDLAGTSIGDADLVELRKIKHLHTLILDETPVTDAGLKQLRDLTELRELRIDTPGVSDAGAAALKESLGKVSIVRRSDAERVRAQIPQLARTIARLRGRVELDDRGPGQPQVKVIFYAAEITDGQLAGLRGLWLVHHLRLSGESKVGDAGLAGLKGATNLRTLDLSRTAVTDGGLEHLKGLTDLRGLYLADTHVQGTGLSHLKGLKKLQRLDLGSTGVGDKALAQLKGLTQLRELSLDFTQVSDASLDCLTGMTSLEKVNVRGTRMTPAGMAALRRALPQAVIFGD
jgi:hypothetical protein